MRPSAFVVALAAFTAVACSPPEAPDDGRTAQSAIQDEQTWAAGPVPDLCGTWKAVELSASIASRGASARPSLGEERAVDSHTFCVPISVNIPSRIDGNPGSPESKVTLSFTDNEDHARGPRTVRCMYEAPGKRASAADGYVLQNCSGGYRGGSSIKAQSFELELKAPASPVDARTARVALSDGSTPPAGASRQFIATSPALAGLVLEVKAGALPPFAVTGLREGPDLEERETFVSPGQAAVGPSFEVVGTGPFPEGAVRIVVRYDEAVIAQLPADARNSLRLIHIIKVIAPAAFEQEDVPGGVVDAGAQTLTAVIPQPGPYYPAVNDSRPIEYGGGPVMNNGLNVYLIWVGDFTSSPAADPRSPVRTFLNGLGSSPYYDILSTYGISNRRVTIAGEVVYADYTALTTAAGAKVDAAFGPVSRALNEKVFTSHPDADPDGLYLVVGAPGVTETSRIGSYCSDYCGWHASATSSQFPGVTIKHAFVGHGDTCGGMGYPGPHGSGAVDYLISCLAHEVVETVTDPESTAWRQPSEVADHCNGMFPGRVVTAGQYSDMALGGDRFLVQALWVNQEGGYCALAIEQLGIDATAPAGGLALNEIGNFTVRLTNTGAARLDAGSLYITARANGLLATEPVPLKVSVALDPGASADVLVPVQAPYEIDGNVAEVGVSFTVTELANNAHTFPNRGFTTVDVRRAPILIDQAACTIELPVSVLSGQQAIGTARFRNVGTTEWLPLSYRFVGLPLEYLHPELDNFPHTLYDPVYPENGASNPPNARTSYGFQFLVNAPMVTSAQTLDIGMGVANPAGFFMEGCAASITVVCDPATDPTCTSGSGQRDDAAYLPDVPDVSKYCAKTPMLSCYAADICFGHVFGTPPVITMQNSGGTAWSKSAGYALSVLDPKWGVSAVDFADADVVGPGGSYTFSFNPVAAPSSSGGGEFRQLKFQMSRNGTPFGEPTPDGIQLWAAPCGG